MGVYHFDQIILESDEVLLSYNVTDTGTLWHLVRGGRVAGSGWIEISREELTDLIGEYRSAFEKAPTRRDLDKHHEDLSNRLFGLLLSPALLDLKKEERIILVPDGVLGVIPFEALLMETSPNRYVGDEYDVAYTHSGTSLTLVRTFKKKHNTTQPVFVLADPVFDHQDDRLSGVKIAREPGFQIQLMRAMGRDVKREDQGMLFDRISETGRLATALKILFGPQTDLLTGINASKENLQNKSLDRYRYIVFATHGILDRDLPYLRQPALVLNQIETKNGHDGFFTLTDIMSTKLNCDVAALIGCRTGLGRTGSGEGVMHLGRAFQYAGSKSVLVSLWNVADKSTTMLIESFFTYLKQGRKPRTALRRAREDLRKYQDGIYDHPFYWGAFILIGS